jgi:hypothetical protein
MDYAQPHPGPPATPGGDFAQRDLPADYSRPDAQPRAYSRPGPGAQPGDYGRAGSDAQPGDYRHPQPGTPPWDDATMRYWRPRPGDQPEDY